MSNRVFVVQRPAYRDRASGEWITKYDLRPAEEFGKLVDVLPHNMFWDADTIVAQAERILENFNPHEDYILAIGDPVAIATVGIVAYKSGGPVTVLKWDKKAQCYQPFCIHLSSFKKIAGA